MFILFLFYAIINFLNLSSFFSQLLKNKNVLFAGYRNPHPLEHLFLLRIQTDGQITPADALTEAINHLHSELTAIEEGFKVSILHVLSLLTISYILGCS